MPVATAAGGGDDCGVCLGESPLLCGESPRKSDRPLIGVAEYEEPEPNMGVAFLGVCIVMALLPPFNVPLLLIPLVLELVLAPLPTPRSPTVPANTAEYGE